MKMSQAYGVNNTNRDEMGRLLEPKEVWSKYENFGDPARHASRHFDEALFTHLTIEYHKEHGRKPSKAYTTAPVLGVKSIGRTVPGVGFVMWDIITGADRDHVGE